MEWSKTIVYFGWAVLRFVTALCSFAEPLAAAAPSAESYSIANGQALSLSQAQETAFRNNWDLLAAAAGVDAATAQKILAREFPNPTFSLSSSKINADHHPNATIEGNGLWDRSYDTIVAINQLFEIGGKRRLRRVSAAAGYEVARAQFLEARRTLALAVARAYVAALFGLENARVLSESAATLSKEAEVAEVRFKAGEISDSDRAQIQITASRFALDAETARTAAAQARVALEVLLGAAHPSESIVLSDRLEDLASKPAPNAHYGGEWRPDVLAAQAMLRKAQADLQFQRALRIPDPTVQAQYEHEPPDTPNSIGLGLSFALPLWNRNRGNILNARAAQEQARVAYEKARAQALADIQTARLAYEDAERRWRGYRDEIRRKSDQVRQTLSYAYSKGGASLLDMLVAERNDNDIRLAAMQAASDTAVAVATLEAAAFEIQPSELKQ
jgi:outer membrane protein, heavy metal efflux system